MKHLLVVFCALFICSCMFISVKPDLPATPTDFKYEFIESQGLLISWTGGAEDKTLLEKRVDFPLGYQSLAPNDCAYKTIIIEEGTSSYLDTTIKGPETPAIYKITALRDTFKSDQLQPIYWPASIDSAQTSYPHLTYISEDIKDEAVPLMIFLHGAGERGDSLDLLKIHGPFKLIENGQDFEGIIIAPQCPKNKEWQVNRLEILLTETLEQYNIDENRIYLTGLSMGGYGTFRWAIDHPEHFAAIAPICGWGDPCRVDRIRKIPTWIFHGELDRVVPVDKSLLMVDALLEQKADPRLTIYPEAYHDSWTETYENQEFWTWLYQQSK